MKGSTKKVKCILLRRRLWRVARSNVRPGVSSFSTKRLRLLARRCGREEFFEEKISFLIMKLPLDCAKKFQRNKALDRERKTNRQTDRIYEIYYFTVIRGEEKKNKKKHLAVITANRICNSNSSEAIVTLTTFRIIYRREIKLNHLA